MTTVLITDRAWPDLEIERAIIEGAGFRMASGPAVPAAADAIAALTREHQPESILTCWATVDAQAVGASNSLRHVGRIGVGLDNIDVPACTARRIVVTNVPDYCVEEVSDHALAFALAWTRGIVAFDRAVRAGRWDPAQAKLRRLATQTVGIIGFGRIGRATGRKFGAFGCRVLVHSVPTPEPAAGIEIADLDALLTGSDIVVVHVPLVDATRHLIDAPRIALMKPGALLINVSRGGIVDTDAVIESLRIGRLGGAALDVLESEPDVPRALLEQETALLTPHVAFSSDTSLAELRKRAAEEAVRVLRGQPPLNACNAPHQ